MPIPPLAIPDYPYISNILVRAASDHSFCIRLLADPVAAMTSFDLPPDDRAIVSEIRANSLPDFAAKLKAKIEAGDQRLSPYHHGRLGCAKKALAAAAKKPGRQSGN